MTVEEAISRLKQMPPKSPFVFLTPDGEQHSIDVINYSGQLIRIFLHSTTCANMRLAIPSAHYAHPVGSK